MNIKLLGDRIAVKVKKPSDISSGGIYIGEQIDDGLVKECVTGEVVVVGPGMKNSKGGTDSMWGIKIGDTVQFSPVCSHTDMIDGMEVTFIRRDAVVGVSQ